MNILLWLCLLVLPSATPPEEILNQAVNHYQKGEYKKAVDLLAPIGKKPDATAEISFWLGKSFLKVREWDKAVKEMEKIVEMEPANAVYHLWLGRAYGARAENRFFGFNDARRLHGEFKKAKALAPENIDIRFDLLEFYAQAPGIVGGGEDKAWIEAEEITKLNPIVGYTARATIYERKEKWDLAQKEYMKATEEYPENADIHKDMAQFQLSRENYKGALENALRSLSLNDASKQGLLIVAISRIHLGRDLEKAEQDLQTFLSNPLEEEDPAPEEIYYWQGVLYHQKGEKEKSKEAFNRTLEINPKHEMAKQYLKNHF